MSLRSFRISTGLTQSELARRAGVSRQLVGAVEAGRHLPRVDAALALAEALGVPVDSLFGSERPPVDALSGEPTATGAMVRSGRVGDRIVTAGVRLGPEGWGAADGAVEGGRVSTFASPAPGPVIAGCEPGLQLLESVLRSRGVGAVAIGASTAAARAALRAGRLHAAVVHGAAPAEAEPGVVRFGVASWRVGLSAEPDAPAGWVQRALGGATPVIEREPGAGVQAAFEAARTGAPDRSHVRRAGSHLEAVSWALATGLPAVTIEPAARAVGAQFHAIETHVAELWVAEQWLDERSMLAALEVLTSGRFRRQLSAVGGYDLTSCGVRVA